MHIYTKWVIYGFIVSFFPLLFNGLFLYAYFLLFQNNFLFYFLLPLNILINVIAYLIMRCVFAHIIVKKYGYPKEGEYKYPSKDTEAWFANSLLLDQFSYIRTILNVPPQATLWFFRRAFNAKIGKLKLFGYGDIIDPHLIEIGDGTVIGHKCVIAAHFIERNKIIFKKVKIGKNCTIGCNSVISPGAKIGDNTIIGAHSFVPKGAKLDANSVYAGTPVRKLKTKRFKKQANFQKPNET